MATRVWAVVRDSAERFSDSDAPRRAALMSYYTLFSLLPMLLLVGALAENALGDSSLLRSKLLRWAGGAGMSAGGDLLAQALDDVARRAPSPTAGIGLGVLGALFGASGVVLELDQALARIFRCKPRKLNFFQSLLGMLRNRLSGLIVVVVTSLVLLATTLARGALELPDWVPGSALLGNALSLGLGGGALTAGIALCFRLLPDVPVSWGAAWKGALVASVLLHLIREPFTWFVVNLTKYAAYGVIGGVLGVLTWFQVAAYALLFGACVAAESLPAAAESASAQDAPDQLTRASASTRSRSDASRPAAAGGDRG